MRDLLHRTPARWVVRIVAAVLLLHAAFAAFSCSSGGGSSGGMMGTPPTVSANIASIQSLIFTPKCALSGCHTGPTPQPLQGAGMDLSVGNSLDSLFGPVVGGVRSGVPSTLDPTFMRAVEGDFVNSYLYMKIVDDPRINVPLVPGICSLTTATTCAIDADCPAGEVCTLVGERMPRNDSELSAAEKNAIAQWLLNRAAGAPGPPGY